MDKPQSTAKHSEQGNDILMFKPTEYPEMHCIIKPQSNETVKERLTRRIEKLRNVFTLHDSVSSIFQPLVEKIAIDLVTSDDSISDYEKFDVRMKCTNLKVLYEKLLHTQDQKISFVDLCTEAATVTASYSYRKLSHFSIIHYDQQFWGKEIFEHPSQSSTKTKTS